MEMSIKFPPEYPFRPPLVVINAPLYHPNFRQNTNLCNNFESWSPAFTAVKWLGIIRNRIGFPDLNSCCGVPEIKRMMKERPEKYDKLARKAAAKSIPSSRCKSARSTLDISS